jgi:hypothetical protein
LPVDLQQPLPFQCLRFFRQFIDGLRLLRSNINWCNYRVSIVARAHNFVTNIIKHPVHYLLPQLVRFRALLPVCPCCNLAVPCSLCEFVAASLNLILEAHRPWFAQAIVLYRRFPAGPVHHILSFIQPPSLLSGTTRIRNLLEFVINFRFAPEIGSRITRALFLVWVEAVSENRLEPFQDPLFNHHAAPLVERTTLVPLHQNLDPGFPRELTASERLPNAFYNIVDLLRVFQAPESDSEEED